MDDKRKALGRRRLKEGRIHFNGKKPMLSCVAAASAR